MTNSTDNPQEVDAKASEPEITGHTPDLAENPEPPNYPIWDAIAAEFESVKARLAALEERTQR